MLARNPPRARALITCHVLVCHALLNRQEHLLIVSHLDLPLLKLVPKSFLPSASTLVRVTIPLSESRTCYLLQRVESFGLGQKQSRHGRLNLNFWIRSRTSKVLFLRSSRPSSEVCLAKTCNRVSLGSTDFPAERQQLLLLFLCLGCMAHSVLIFKLCEADVVNIIEGKKMLV